MYLGKYKIDDYLPIPAVCHRLSSGAAYAATVLTYSIYEEGNPTGLDEDVDMTPATPFDSIVGFYYARRQLTAAAGFEAGKTYVVVVKATVDSVAAIEAHVFQVEPAAIVANTTQFAGQTITCGAGVTVGAYVGNATAAIAVNGSGYVTYANAAPPAASAIADAVWDEASTGHTDAGKAGEQLWTDIDAILDDTGTAGVICASGTVTTLTNAPGDSSGVTELLTRIPDATAGAAGGLFIAGSNAATTVASLSVTGQLDAGNILVDTTTALTGAVTAPAGITANLTGDITGNLSGSVGSVTTKTGFKLASDGLDSVVVETGLNARQALSIISASAAGVLAGAATTSITIAAAGVPATNRVTATVDADGNRSAVTLDPPT